MPAIGLVILLIPLLGVPFLPVLPPWWLYTSLWCLVPVVWCWAGGGRHLVLFLLGLGLALLNATTIKNALLPTQLEKQWLAVNATIDGLPQIDSRRAVFRLRVGQFKNDAGQPVAPRTQYIRVSLYAGYHQQFSLEKQQYWRRELIPGRELQAQVRLKRPRGMVNPGGFDYERWLVANGIQAVGSINAIQWQQDSQSATKVIHSWQYYRYRISLWLHHQAAAGTLEQPGFMRALILGDKSDISTAEWQVLTQTGTVHLMVISGLHIGFVASIGWLVGAVVGRCLLVLSWLCRLPTNPLFSMRWPPLLFSVLAAVAYSQLAGLGVATQRALIMLIAVYLALLSNRSISPLRIWLLAMLVVVVVDPLAGLGAGFWLSFGIVGLLLFCFAGRQRLAQPSGHYPLDSLSARVKGLAPARVMGNWLQLFFNTQAAVFLGLSLPLLFALQQFSLIGPVANAVAVPVVSLLVVPFIMLGGIGNVLFGYGDTVFFAADSLLQVLWRSLQVMAQWGEQGNRFLAGLFAGWQFTPFGTVLGYTGVVLLLLPRGCRTQLMAVATLLLALLSGFRNPEGFRLQVIDVGQGLAVWIQDGSHTLLYDTGARFSDRFDAGENIIVPLLQRQGVQRINTLIVSHGDHDHRGGLAGVLKHIAADRLIVGQPEKSRRMINGSVQPKPCVNGGRWQWGGNEYQLVQVPQALRSRSNNASCGLLISNPAFRIVLPGDLEAAAEQYVLAQGAVTGPVDILLAPHHGSRTSSSPDFVRLLQPAHVVFSTSYLNSYGHPHADIVERYQRVGSRLYNTAMDGALTFERTHNGWQVTQEREKQRRFWQ